MAGREKKIETEDPQTQRVRGDETRKADARTDVVLSLSPGIPWYLCIQILELVLRFNSIQTKSILRPVPQVTKAPLTFSKERLPERIRERDSAGAGAVGTP